MGVLSELIVARRSEARAVAESVSPSRDWKGIVWKGLDQIKLGTLWMILEGEKIEVVNVVARSERMQLLAESSENGPWVVLIPEELRDLMAQLSNVHEEKTYNVAIAWAATEELQDWDRSDVTGLLQEVIDLADGARLDGLDLLLWICL